MIIVVLHSATTWILQGRRESEASSSHPNSDDNHQNIADSIGGETKPCTCQMANLFSSILSEELCHLVSHRI
jgi:hypothetical protein